MGIPAPETASGGDPVSIESLGALFAAVAATRSRLEKRRLLVEYLGGLPADVLGLGVTYLLGRPFARSSQRRLSVGGATLVDALIASHPELSPQDVSAAWRRHGDASDMAADLWATVPSPGGPPVGLAELAGVLEEIHRAA